MPSRHLPSALRRRLPVFALAMTAIAEPGTAQAAPGPVVAVTGGRIQGSPLATGGTVFKGIPFAAPPVGDLRWHAPVAVKPWSGVKATTAYADACAQNKSGWNEPAWAQSSEDCLYLNVWTPRPRGAGRLPVMVWIHGGANSGGSAKGGNAIEPPFDGESLSRRGVVVVTIPYRLNIFGFLPHPEARAESPKNASGNYAFLDQVAALRWVRDNIGRFGGDPGNVTLFGQSAGAQDTTVLLASPLTRGLIHKAIVESGSPMIVNREITPARADQVGLTLAHVLKAPADSGSLRYLRGLSTAQILGANAEFRKALAEQKLSLGAVVDGDVVPVVPADTYRAGQQPAIPMIVGSNAQDGPGYQPLADPTPAKMEALVRGRVKQVYGKYPDLASRALRLYGFDDGKAQDFAPYGTLDRQVGVDAGFRCGGTVVARWQNPVAPTFRYEFTAGTAAHPPLHSAELDYVFGYLRDQGSVPTLAKLSQQMQLYWTNFARTGDPNGQGLPRWPRYDSRGTYVDFGNDGPLVKDSLRAGLCDIYADKVDRDLASR